MNVRENNWAYNEKEVRTMNKNDYLKDVLEHPIATIIVTNVLLTGVAKIIGAIKGAVVEPSIRVEVHKNGEKED